jgi:hypothetical protein
MESLCHERGTAPPGAACSRRPQIWASTRGFPRPAIEHPAPDGSEKQASLPPPPPSRIASHRIACSPQTAKGSRRGVGAGPEPCSPRHHMSVCVRGAYRGVAALRWRKKRVIVPPVRGGARTAAARLLLPTHTKRSESDMRFGFWDGVRLVAGRGCAQGRVGAAAGPRR